MPGVNSFSGKFGAFKEERKSMLRKVLFLVSLVILFSAANAVADVDAGFNLDWSKTEGADNGDWGVGGRVDFGGQFRGMIAFDYFFANAGDLFDSDDLNSDDFDLEFWELNGNLLYEFPTDPVHPYFGAGVGIARRTFDDINDIFDDKRSEFGVNVLGGLKFGHAAVEPFVEARWTFYPDDDNPSDTDDFGDLIHFGDRFVISGGIVF
jgi:Outer membrane protein beta-barrel domain